MKSVKLFFRLFFIILAFFALSLGIFYFLNRTQGDTAPTPTTPPQSNSQTAYPTVIIDAGHGGEDGGTSGENGVLEKELNLDLAKRVNELFKAAGINTVMTRDEDRLLYDPLSDYKGRKKILDMQERLRIASKHDNAIFISIHMNSFPEKKYSGLQVYYSNNNTDSERIANAVQKTTAFYLTPANDRKIKIGKDIYLLDRLHIPALLIECGFLSNPEECARLSTEEYRNELAFWIFYAVIAEIQ
jgi:N-acetylmuramoyl-L-alanine amidase